MILHTPSTWRFHRQLHGTLSFHSSCRGSLLICVESRGGQLLGIPSHFKSLLWFFFYFKSKSTIDTTLHHVIAIFLQKGSEHRLKPFSCYILIQRILVRQLFHLCFCFFQNSRIFRVFQHFDNQFCYFHSIFFFEPRLVIAGVPTRIPLVLNGLRVSNGIEFLLTVMLTRWPSNASASFSVKLKSSHINQQ